LTGGDILKSIGILLVIFSMTSLIQSVNAENQVMTSTDEPWFDGSGAFHYSSPVKYINQVISGSVKDQFFENTVKTLFPDAKELTEEYLVQLSAHLFESHSAAAFYHSRSQMEIDGQRAIFLKRFKENAKSDARGTLKLQGYGLTTRGPSEKLSGSNTNIVIAYPADPALIAQFTRCFSNRIPDVEKLILNAVSNGPAKEFSKQSKVDLIGRLEIEDMVPGWYLVWVNQYSILKYLYRIEVKPDQIVELQLKTPFELSRIEPNQNPSKAESTKKSK